MNENMFRSECGNTIRGVSGFEPAEQIKIHKSTGGESHSRDDTRGHEEETNKECTDTCKEDERYGIHSVCVTQTHTVG